MAYLDDLKTSRDQLAERLVEVTASAKPSYSIDGQSVSWSEYVAMLNKQMQELNKLIVDAEPFEIHSIGYTG